MGLKEYIVGCGHIQRYHKYSQGDDDHHCLMCKCRGFEDD
jgi:hypothetical protein